MTLLAPWALWFAAIGGAVVALYLLKIKRRWQEVPALDFWRELAGRTQVHSLFKRLKRWLSMLLWLVIVACLVLALGNPILALGQIKPRAIAIIIDNSASMQAREGEGAAMTRLALGRNALRELTTRRPVSDEWLLIEAALEPRVLHAWTYDAKAIHKAADALQPFNGAGDLKAAVELATQLLAGKQNPCVTIISDGAGVIDELLKTDDRIVYWPVGESRDNLGITAISVRLHRQQSAHYVYVQVTNASTQQIETQLVFKIDDVTTHVEPLEIAAQSTWEKTIVLDSSAGGVLSVSLDRDDDLTVDNQVFAILEPIQPASVWLVSKPDEAFFFEQALAAMDPLVNLDQSHSISPEEYEVAAARVKPEQTPDLIIFNNCAPKSAAVPAHACLYINAWPAEMPVSVLGVIESPQLFIAPRPHPVMEHLNLQGTRLAQATRVRLADRATVLAHSDDAQPLIFLVDSLNSAGEQRQALCLAFDVLDSDLPFRNAFPLLLRNSVAHFSIERPSWIRSQYRLGEVIEPLRPLPLRIEQITLTALDHGQMSQSTVAVRGGRFACPAGNTSAAFRLTIDQEHCYAAVNLTDPAESSIAPVPAAKDPKSELMLSGRLFGAMPWFAFAAAAAMLVTLEWLTYHMRWTE